MAKEITIRVPDGYVWKIFGVAALIITGLIFAPYYANYLDRVRAQTRIVEAQAAMEARRIEGECPVKGVNLP